MTELNTARLVPIRVAALALPLLAVVGIWAAGHAASLTRWAQHDSTGKGLSVAYAVTFAMFVWQSCLFLLDRPAKTTTRQQAQLDALRVLVAVPTFNEPFEAVRSTVTALLAQSRLPEVIYVVDDGSTVDYQPLLPWFMNACARHGVVGRWQRTDNGGKRHAQATALRETVGENHIDIVWTVDSDARPDVHCLAEGLKPLANPAVRTVTSLILSENTRASWLTRMMDLVMLTAQLTDRSAMSAAGSVLVNSGASAFYRADIILDNLDAYLHETFFGRTMKISDDSMLTLFGAIQGRTVQQPTSMVFTTMPDTLRGHWKQNLRWNRGSFIRSWWRMKYLPIKRFAFWWHLTRWAGFFINTALLLFVFAIAPAADGTSLAAYAGLFAWCAVVQLSLGSALTLRYFAVRRSDQSRAYQIGTWLLTPLALLWSATVLRINRWWAIATCTNMGWQTRPETSLKQQDRPDGWLPADDSETMIFAAIR